MRLACNVQQKCLQNIFKSIKELSMIDGEREKETVRKIVSRTIENAASDYFFAHNFAFLSLCMAIER